MEISNLTTLYIIVMNAMLTFTVLKLLNSQAKNGYKKNVGQAILGTWLVIVTVLLMYFDVLPDNSVMLFIVILLGVGLAGVVLSPLFKIFLALPHEFLLLPQAFRMFFGAGFIIEAAFGIIPLAYGVVDGVLHITTAFLATTLAIYIAHGFKPMNSLVLVNLFGLLDIVVVAAGIAFFILSDIGTTHNVFYAVFFAAPIFIWLHLLSLYKVYVESKEETKEKA